MLNKTFTSLLFIALFSTSAYSLEKQNNHTNKFSKELSEKYDIFLKDKLKLNKVGFNLTPKLENDKITFSPPDYTERETFFSLYLDVKTNTINGKVLDKSSLEIIEPFIKKHFKNSTVNIETFPFKNIDKDYAISNKPITDLYVKPIDLAGENLATQTRLGTPLKILDLSPDKKFVKVISEDDKYIAWINRKDILEKDQNEFENWKNSRNYMIKNDINKPVKIFSGTILKGLDNGKNISLTLPDDKIVIVNKSDTLNIADLSKNKDKVVMNAKNRLDLGLNKKTNYLWGGSVNENIDCSGFNQSIFRLEGIMLPRDADQQQSFTKPVAVSLDKINELKAGDLLFFSGNRNYATHTGIYIGDYKFIHSSPKGQYRGIKINSLKGGGEYDKYLQKIYFGGGRI